MANPDVDFSLEFGLGHGSFSVRETRDIDK